MSERDAASDLKVCEAATPGEWRWEINLKAKQMSLKSAKGGGWTVLDFVRWGMSGAKSRFLDIKRCLMIDANDLAAVIPGREHHASWCQTIDHPDARFIATAREALPWWIREAERLRAENERLTKLRDAESQEHFDDSFNTKGLTSKQCMDKAEELLIECRKEAAKLAAEWLNKHGYFNGEMENAIYCYDDGTCNVQVTLSCYGLPNRSEE